MKKKSFLLYVDSSPQIEMLSDEEAGQLIKGIFRYVDCGEELMTNNRVLAMTFAVFKAQIDRGQEKYNSICKKRAEAANRKWELYKSMQKHTNGCTCIQMDANDTSKGNSNSHSESESDSHSESDIKKESKKKKVDAAHAATLLESRKGDFYNSLIPFVSVYGKDMVRAFFDYWSEPNKSRSKMKFELERTWELSRRLNTWASRDNQFNKRTNGTNRSDNATAKQRAEDAASTVARLLAEDDDDSEVRR